MKIIVLGGAGVMGKRAVEDLVNTSDGLHISLITIADINMSGATEVASALKTAAIRVSARKLDAFDQQQVINTISEYDLVVSTLGPYHIFEERMVRAVLEVGKDYISICDEWDVVDNIINQYDRSAREKGIRIICGIGASPGITNIAAMHLADQLETVRRIDISVWLPLDTGAGAAAIEHGVYIMSGETAVWRDGKREMIRACSEKVHKMFPGAGRQAVWNMGHSEPVSLPLALRHKSIETVNFYMGFGMLSFLLTGPSRLGWYENPSVRSMFTRAFVSIEKVLSMKSARNGSSRIDVWGSRNNNEEHLKAFGVSTMQESTALALSAGVQMMAARQLKASDGGVYSPESIFPTSTALEILDRKGIRIFHDRALTQPLV